MSGLVLTLPPPATGGTGGGGDGAVIAPGNPGEIVVYGGLTRDTTALASSGTTVADVVSTASIIPPSTPAQNSFLVSGGAIVWTSAYNFRVAAASYYINGVAYSSLEQTITLGNAHATLDRIDVIAVNDAAVVVVVPGTAASQPSEPDVDPGTQLKLGVVLVTKASSEPVGAAVTNLWSENTGTPAEWAWTVVGTGFTIGSTVNPRTGTKCIEGTNVIKGAYTQAALAANTFIDPNDYDSLVLYIRSKAAWASNRALKFQWYVNNVAKGQGLNLQSGVFGFDSNNVTSYQMVVIPIVQFAVANGTACNQLRLIDTNGAIGFYLDDISLQQGIPSSLNVNALTQAQADSRYAPLPRVRKVGVTVDGNTGVKGSVQVDFQGAIVGWSIQADVAGSISVDVCKKAGTQALPAVPNTTTDKISASAPIALSSQQTKGVDSVGVQTWSTAVAQWDSILFNVTSILTITRATLWLRIQEF